MQRGLGHGYPRAFWGERHRAPALAGTQVDTQPRMPSTCAPTRFTLLAAALLAFAAAPLRAQELGPYVGGGVGGIRDVRRPFGGGIAGTLLFHDWLGIHASAGYYWTLEHRLVPNCHPGTGEPVVCTGTLRLSSRSHFPQVDALLMLRKHFTGKGWGVEGGLGPAYVNVTNEIRTNTDSIYSPRITSSAVGLVYMAGIWMHPQWKLPLTFEGAYAYHQTGAFKACTNQSPSTDPLCNRHLNFHELRFSALWRVGAAPKP